MKSAEVCENIHEIRECIDQIDRTMIDNLALRATYVEAAARFKKSIADVNADIRVKTMVEKRRTWAQESSISPDFIHALFDVIVSFFIKGEMTRWRKENRTDPGVSIVEAVHDDIPAILALQKRAFIQEAEAAGGIYTIPPITQTKEEMEREFHEYTVLKAVLDGLIVGSARAKAIGATCHIGRLAVEPVYQKRGYGKTLMTALESLFPLVNDFELFTGVNSQSNIRFYSNLGYSCEAPFDGPDGLKFIRMRKKNNR
jgi:chorismate mutase/ribosomal protein S18 acetylase RimI-like enzyme